MAKAKLNIAKRVAYVGLGIMLMLVWLLTFSDVFSEQAFEVLAEKVMGPPAPLPSQVETGWEAYIGGAVVPLIFYAGKKLIDLGIAYAGRRLGVDV